MVRSGAYKQLPYLTTVVQWSGDVAATAKKPRGAASPVPPPPRVLSWPQFQGLAFAGAEAVCGAAALAERAACVKPGHCAALVYTSGTTGDPKAVRAGALSPSSVVAIKIISWRGVNSLYTHNLSLSLCLTLFRLF